MPHLLIAGTTGSVSPAASTRSSRPSSCARRPTTCGLILIDPKRIELSHFESVPHLLTPVVSSPKEASAVLANCLAEMERRYERLSSVRAATSTRRTAPSASAASRRSRTSSS
jgi:S-DNA-T family DNA segregation ATPase FtsK/SpoIIIE